MRKIVINAEYGGFSVSSDVIKLMIRWDSKSAQDVIDWYQTQIGASPRHGYHVDRFISRSDPLFVKAVETLGKRANGSSSSLEIVEVDDNEHVQIEEHDGKERIRRIHCDCCLPIEKR